MLCVCGLVILDYEHLCLLSDYVGMLNFAVLLLQGFGLLIWLFALDCCVMLSLLCLFWLDSCGFMLCWLLLCGFVCGLFSVVDDVVWVVSCRLIFVVGLLLLNTGVVVGFDACIGLFIDLICTELDISFKSVFVMICVCLRYLLLLLVCLMFWVLLIVLWGWVGWLILT